MLTSDLTGLEVEVEVGAMILGIDIVDAEVEAIVEDDGRIIMIVIPVTETVISMVGIGIGMIDLTVTVEEVRVKVVTVTRTANEALKPNRRTLIDW